MSNLCKLNKKKKTQRLDNPTKGLLTVQKLNQKREAVLSNLRAAQHKASLPDQAKALIRKTNEILGVVEDIPEKSTSVNVHEYLYSYKQVFDNKKVIFRLQSFKFLLKI